MYIKILRERGEIAPQVQFLLLSTIFCYLILDFSSRQVVIRDNRSRDNESRLYLSVYDMDQAEGPRCGLHFSSNNRWEVRTTHWTE